MPVYGKRSVNPWSHHHQQQQQQQQPTDPSYCWYHPLHSSGGSIQGHAHGHGHGPSPVPPSLVQINQINAFSASHHLTQQPQQSMGHGLQTQNGNSLDDEWKNIHVMLNCILGMVEKTKRALAILQRRGCSSPAAAAPPPGVVAAQNGTSNNSNSNGNNPSSTNGVQVESSTGERDNSLKRLSGEIVAQTIRATEDRVAEVKRRAGVYFKVREYDSVKIFNFIILECCVNESFKFFFIKLLDRSLFGYSNYFNFKFG